MQPIHLCFVRQNAYWQQSTKVFYHQSFVPYGSYSIQNFLCIILLQFLCSIQSYSQDHCQNNPGALKMILYCNNVLTVLLKYINLLSITFCEIWIICLQNASIMLE